ncbi:hypothetical protein H0H81_002993 [Sphagnurus paluster]|uniref:Uncharacterized protein n=1 Tax=Sphagnurus paluster TaxID=117069 RepID=A0A9P7FS71_9AGAR|nr:hypothetical protein H0H81_002993 [Sphagnurus paluster]
MTPTNSTPTLSSARIISQPDTAATQNPAAEVARLKRTIAELHENLSNGSNKCPTSTVTLGRGICRAVSLFVDISRLVKESDRREQLLADDDEDDEDEDHDDPTANPVELERDRDCMYAAYLELCALVPGFKANLLNTDGAVLNTYISSLTRGANDARSDDISKLMKAVAHWLNELGTTTTTLNPEDRSMRGLKHDTTGRLLCPIEYDWDDEAVRVKLCAGEEGFDINSSLFVRCFYKHAKGDPNDVEKNFLRSYLLVKVYLAFFFFAPSSANRVRSDNDNENDNLAVSGSSASRRTTKSTVAQKMGLNIATPCTIAYAAVLLHFSLTDAPNWKAMHNGFSYEHLYNFIIDFFEDARGDNANERTMALLCWWNKKVFPARQAAAANSRASMDKLKVQRAARERGGA